MDAHPERRFFLTLEQQASLKDSSDELMLALMKVNRLQAKMRKQLSDIRQPLAEAYFDQPVQWQESRVGCLVYSWLERLDEEPCDEVLEFVQEYAERPETMEVVPRSLKTTTEEQGGER